MDACLLNLRRLDLPRPLPRRLHQSACLTNLHAPSAELVIQETEERILQKEKEKMERAIQQRMDIALANEYQRQLKAIRRDEEKREEEEFRRTMRESRPAICTDPLYPAHRPTSMRIAFE